MKKHPLLFNFILTMAIQIGVYLIEIFEVQIIEPLLQALGVRSEGIMAPTEVVRFFVMRVVLIAAAISAGIIRSKVYFLDTIFSVDICWLCNLLSRYSSKSRKKQHSEFAIDCRTFRLWYYNVFCYLSSCIFVLLSASSLYNYPYTVTSERP